MYAENEEKMVEEKNSREAKKTMKFEINETIIKQQNSCARKNKANTVAA